MDKLDLILKKADSLSFQSRSMVTDLGSLFSFDLKDVLYIKVGRRGYCNFILNHYGSRRKRIVKGSLYHFEKLF